MLDLQCKADQSLLFCCICHASKNSVNDASVQWNLNNFTDKCAESLKNYFLCGVYLYAELFLGILGVALPFCRLSRVATHSLKY